MNNTLDVAQLPNVPSGFPDTPAVDGHQSENDDIDFEALSKRFENLKKRK